MHNLAVCLIHYGDGAVGFIVFKNGFGGNLVGDHKPYPRFSYRSAKVQSTLSFLHRMHESAG